MSIIRLDWTSTTGKLGGFHDLSDILTTLSVVFSNTTGAGYRGQLFVNGWQFGRLYGDLGAYGHCPQRRHCHFTIVHSVVLCHALWS